MPDFLLLFFFFLRKKNNKTSSSICLPLFEKKVLMSTLAISFHSLEICRYDYFSINIYDVMKFIVISLFSHNTTSSITIRKTTDRNITFLAAVSIHVSKVGIIFVSWCDAALVRSLHDNRNKSCINVFFHFTIFREFLTGSKKF